MSRSTRSRLPMPADNSSWLDGCQFYIALVIRNLKGTLPTLPHKLSDVGLLYEMLHDVVCHQGGPRINVLQATCTAPGTCAAAQACWLSNLETQVGLRIHALHPRTPCAHACKRSKLWHSPCCDGCSTTANAVSSNSTAQMSSLANIVSMHTADLVSPHCSKV